MNLGHARSIDLFKFGHSVLAGGVSSPGRAFSEVQTPTLVLERGHGCRVVDVDGNTYVDFIGGLGPLILGHSPEPVRRALAEQAERGTVFGAPNALEYRLAERILASTPWLDRLRFTCSGTEAVMTAVRLAKGCTDRSKIVKFNGGYHGHSDVLLARGTKRLMRAAGGVHNGLDDFVLDNTLIVEYNDAAGAAALFADHGRDIAAVVVEPCATNMGLVKPLPGFLARLRQLCDDAGALLIFDEVVSGFRFRHGSLSIELGIEPDFVTFGKIIGGGTPIGAYGGRAEHLTLLQTAGGVFQGGTFAGNPLSMAAGLATLEETAREGFYERLERLGALVEDVLVGGFRRTGLPYGVQRKGSLFSFILAEGLDRLTNFADVQRQDTALFAGFHHDMSERGFLLPPTIEEPVFISAAHTESDLRAFAEAAVDALAARRAVPSSTA